MWMWTEIAMADLVLLQINPAIKYSILQIKEYVKFCLNFKVKLAGSWLICSSILQSQSNLFLLLLLLRLPFFFPLFFSTSQALSPETKKFKLGFNHVSLPSQAENKHLVEYHTTVENFYLRGSCVFPCLIATKFHTSPIAFKVCCWSGVWLNKLSKKYCTDLLTWNRLNNKLKYLQNQNFPYPIDEYHTRTCSFLLKMFMGTGIIRTEDKSPVGCSAPRAMRLCITWKVAINQVKFDEKQDCHGLDFN